MISVPGIGSGLDINAIVSQLVAVEGDTKTILLASRRSEIESDISAFGLIKSTLSTFLSAISDLKSNATFEKRTASSGTAAASDDLLFTATVDEAVATGVYDVEVRALAESQKLMTKAYTASTTVVGTGTIAITVGTNTFSVNITSGSDTVTDVRDAINDATNNTGVSATIINVDDGSGGTDTKLVLSSDSSGTANALTVTIDDDDLDDTDSSGLSALYYDISGGPAEQMTEINAAVDAEVYIDGQKVLSSSNTVVDAIQGVTINLIKDETGTINPLTISLDKASVTAAINSFISSYNNMIGGINVLQSFDADTGAAGVLLGDATLRNLTSAIRRELNGTVNGITGSLTNLVEIGITTTTTGKLELDSTVLDDVLTTNFDDMDDLFASTDGIATKLDSILTSYTQSTTGILDTKISGLTDSVDRIDDDLVRLNDKLLKLETRLLAQFSGLDVLLSSIQATGTFLDRQFDLLDNFFKK